MMMMMMMMKMMMDGKSASWLAALG
jgi:hypothetical protein